jgi:protein-S-isoprenylcysteine O-methyltransferase Ste14
MTVAHLVFAAATTAYILIAIGYEERDLINEHGKAYEQYRESVSMLIPFTKKKNRIDEKTVGTAA